MNEEPLVWHYGLVAQLWAEFSGDTPELPYYQKQIDRFGQPVLDLACGTGRLLLPILRSGIDVDGCDISTDMLYHCREQAVRIGFHPQLFEMPMHELDLPRSYKTIYMCGSFGLAGSRQLDQRTLERCFQYLEPGGALLFNLDVEFANPKVWQMWLKDNRETLPQPWPEEGSRQSAAAGHDLIYRSRLLAIDPLEQTFLREIRIEKSRDGTLISQEERTLHGNMYFKNEVVCMLQAAGFGAIEIGGDYTDQPATSYNSELNFIARK